MKWFDRRPSVRVLSGMIVAFVLVSGHPALSQFIADPNDGIYRFLDIWEQRGYFPPLPSLRPYPLQLVEEALSKVIQNGSRAEAQTAQRFLSKYTARVIPLAVSGSVAHEYRNTNDGHLDRTIVGLETTDRVLPNCAYSVGGKLFLEEATTANAFPVLSNTYASSVKAETGGFAFNVGLGAQEADSLSSFSVVSGSASFGTDRLYLQGGLHRTSYGPVFGSVVLGPQAPQAGHLSLTYRTSWVTYSGLFMELQAILGVKPDGTVYRLNEELDHYPQKNLILHSFTFHPFSWLHVGLINTVVFCDRISPIYIFPAPVHGYYASAYLSSWDNAFVGFEADIDFPFGARLSLLLYVDDLHWQRLTVLDFDTNGNKVAGQANLSWVLPLSVPARISAEYLMITPYMYTQDSTAVWNYLQYTQKGRSLGSALEPNSDQWTIRAFAMPYVGLQFELLYRRARHGNGSDYGEGSVDGDGSIFDDGRLPSGDITFKDRSSFLTQDVLEVVNEFTVSAEYLFEVWHIETKLGLGYSLELVKNRDLDPAAPAETNHYFSFEASIGI